MVSVARRAMPDFTTLSPLVNAGMFAAAAAVVRLAGGRLAPDADAVSNILGTNCLEVALFLLADIVYRDGPILAATDVSGLLAAAIGMAATAILLLGLLERRNRTVMGMGIVSRTILVVYGAGLAGPYSLR